ncbi:Rho termination factor N-terminal domain-containing protein [Micromonospora soli]|uniref:Rho termination factor N-terminal domain-containing protein n=1 Tax=Micromonospora sp. NBRC 110009 TaxID=3061627 RepID=UPI0026720861|nr:Rho termination factor N-terminal domain-containing protein [Micromonospora sp. NBRC 110009]WKT99854.1 Rho termination factor N-terminal domain-containing protein [Micromonospora sp. NBRC 110009]
MTEPTRAVLARVAEFLAGLSAAEVAALAEGRARLAVLPAADAPAPAVAGDGGAPPGRAAAPHGDVMSGPGTAGPGSTGGVRPVARSSPSGVDVGRAHAALAAMSRRDDGTAYLSSWTARDLRALAARAGLRGVAGLRKMELVERIVDRTIGFRLDSTAIRRR